MRRRCRLGLHSRAGRAVERTRCPTTFLIGSNSATTTAGNASSSELLVSGVFDIPKPRLVSSSILRSDVTDGDDLVLDFFAGSGTTAHAVALHERETVASPAVHLA